MGLFPMPSTRPSNPKWLVVTLHGLISVTILALVAVLIFVFWFPPELRHFTGGLKLFFVLVGVDMVCGPLLTIVLYRTSKSRQELSIDLGLVALIQLGALAYGLNTLAQARPLAQVFETDRFRLVSYADIAENDMEHLPSWFKPWSLAPIRTLGLRQATSTGERLESLNAALQGFDAGQRPQRWQDYSLNRDEALTRSKPLAALKADHPDRRSIIDQATSTALHNTQRGETNEARELRWLPLVSRNNSDGVVLLDPLSLRIRSYAPLDGFK